jgi:hypothetical protein
MFALFFYGDNKMDNDTLRKEKYRCTFKGSDGITISDLIIKATNPNYNRKISLRYGEYILTELLDFEDLKKSRMVGALARFIEMGWVAVENPSIPVEKKEPAKPVAVAVPAVAKAITEAAAQGRPEKQIYASTGPSSSLGFPKEEETPLTEVLSSEQSRKLNSLAISETDAKVALADATVTLDKFNSLRYFQKLKLIKETVDVGLLEGVVTKSNYPQLIHNAKNRIRELKNGR